MPENDRTNGKLLAALSLCTFFVGLNSFVTIPLVPEIARDTGVSAELGGLFVTAYALSYLISAPVFGAISDRVGRKRVILPGMLILGIGAILTGFGDGLAALLVFRAITGIGAGMVEPAVYALIGDRFLYEERGRAIGIVTGVLLSSTVLGVPLGSYLAEAGTWRYTFWILGALAIVSLLLIQAALPKDKPGMETAHEPTSEGVATLGQFRRVVAGSVFFALIATFLYSGGLQGVLANIGLYFSQNFGLDATGIGLVFALPGLAGVLGSVVGGRISDVTGKKTVVCVASVLSAAGAIVFMTVATQNLVFAVVVNVAWSVFYAAGFSALTALISELDPKARGTVLALNTSSMFAGTTAFTAASAALLSFGGFFYLGILSAAASLVVLPLIAFLVKEG